MHQRTRSLQAPSSARGPTPGACAPPLKPVPALVAILVGALAAALLGAGCSEDSAKPPTNEAVAIFGYLYVGEPISSANAISVARVQPIDGRYDAGAAGIDDAVVTVTREGVDPDPPLVLAGIGGGRYVDPDSSLAPHAIWPGFGYALHVTLPDGQTLTARTLTPGHVQIQGGPPVVPRSVRQEVLEDSYPVLVRCDDPEQILLTDVYCLEDWRDARYINAFGPEDTPADYDEYGGDDGEPRHIFAYFHAKDVVSRDDAYLIDFYGAMIAFYGRYQVHISAIDDNIYNYLYRDHPEENGGIVGGIGVFGSAARRTWMVEIVE